MKINKRYIGLAVSTLVLLLSLLLIGPVDTFSHGFYEDEVDFQQIPDEARLGLVPIDDDSCKITFSPKDKHFAGIELFLLNQSPSNGGTLFMTIKDSNGKEVEKEKIDLSEVYDSTWYKVMTKSNLKEGKKYYLSFEVAEGVSVPSMMLVDETYLQDEYIAGNAVISYAYSRSTFNFQEKIIIGILLISIYCAVISIFVDRDIIKKRLKIAACFMVLTSLLSWVYMYNSIDNENTAFEGYQVDSEGLVRGMIAADQDGITFADPDNPGYGLGWYYDLMGRLDSYERQYLSDDNWIDGFNKNEPMIVVNTNIITTQLAKVGNIIQFANGEEFAITDSVDDGNNILITLNSDKPLSGLKYGSLDDVTFYDANHNVLQKSMLMNYESQYGLHGKLFKRIARLMDEESVLDNLHLICSVLAGAVFTLIVLLIAYKYNYLMAACFYATFLLSPWVTNFARNLYWVEFGWFIPMAVGLICLIKIDSRKWRIGCYIAAFISICAKCLCGYEYISVVMMGLISFILVELLTSLINRDKEHTLLLFRTMIIIGIVAVLGFIMAIVIHAVLKGDGHIIHGIKNIIKQDVLRRTSGSNLNAFESENWPAMNASVWETYARYFHFSTSVITGITGNLFGALCLIPLGIFGYDYYTKKMNYTEVFMYIIFFLTSVSWFCLAKNHSYIHVHMNYVLWYFGYVQICLYIIINRLTNTVANKEIKD